MMHVLTTRLQMNWTWDLSSPTPSMFRMNIIQSMLKRHIRIFSFVSGVVLPSILNQKGHQQPSLLYLEPILRNNQTKFIMFGLVERLTQEIPIPSLGKYWYF